MSVANAAPAPTLKPSSFPTYSGPGYAEIKPHNVANIKKGLRQLSSLRARRDPPAKATYLITYNFALPSTVPGKVTVTSYLLQPHAAAITADPPGPRGPVRAWLDGLGTWWALGTFPGPEQSLAEWHTAVGPAVFGSMLEPFLRQEFLKRFKPKEDVTQYGRPVKSGPDVDWQEVAEFLYEVAAELGGAA